MFFPIRALRTTAITNVSYYMKLLIRFVDKLKKYVLIHAQLKVYIILLEIKSVYKVVFVLMIKNIITIIIMNVSILAKVEMV